MSNDTTSVQKLFHPKLMRNFHLLAFAYGQSLSIHTNEAVDERGNPIPWYTYPAIEFLTNLDFSKKSVLEYGSGNSSLWWARRSLRTAAIEDDKAWYEKVKLRSAELQIPNLHYEFESEQQAYVENRAIASADVVIIDGAFRKRCAEFVIDQVRRGVARPAMLIFDNADWFPNTMRELAAGLDWIRVDFSGFSPINDYTLTTSIFINPGYQPRIGYWRDVRSIAAIEPNPPTSD